MIDYGTNSSFALLVGNNLPDLVLSITTLLVIIIIAGSVFKMINRVFGNTRYDESSEENQSLEEPDNYLEYVKERLEVEKLLKE